MTITNDLANWAGTGSNTSVIIANGASISIGNTTNNLIIYGIPNTTSAAITTSGANTKGGATYYDFIKVTNLSANAAFPNKWIRLSNTGNIEVLNSGYNTAIVTITDGGALNAVGPLNINGNQAVNGPAFAAGQDPAATAQTISSGSQQKITFTLEEFDTHGCFANSRFTPTIAGYYQLNSSVRFDGGGTGTGETMITIWKNGSEYHRGWNASGTELASGGWFSMQVSTVAYANGAGDYFEVYLQQTSGANRTITRGANISWFNGCMLRGI